MERERGQERAHNYAQTIFYASWFLHDAQNPTIAPAGFKVLFAADVGEA